MLPSQVSAERLAAQGLSGSPTRRVVDVVERILAVQAQDLRGMRLAVRSRSTGLHARDVDDALSVDRSVVVTWLNRGTLHLVRAEDYWWLHALTAPTMSTQIRRRLAEEGVSPQDAERGVALVERALAADGPMVRDQLRERLGAAGIPTAGQALTYVLIVAAARGLAVRGPVVGAEQAFVLVRDWLGQPQPATFDRDHALAELARRYLAGHGPADDRDLARWAKLPLGDVRRGLAAVGSQLHVRDDGLLDLRRRPGDPAREDGGAELDDAGPASESGPPVPPPRVLPPPKLLGAFDPVLLGWASRDWVVGPHRQLVTTNGIFRPVALVDGRAVGTWTMPAGRVELAPFGPLDPAATAALRAEAADVERFLTDDRPPRQPHGA